MRRIPLVIAHDTEVRYLNLNPLALWAAMGLALPPRVRLAPLVPYASPTVEIAVQDLRTVDGVQDRARPLRGRGDGSFSALRALAMPFTPWPAAHISKIRRTTEAGVSSISRSTWERRPSALLTSTLRYP